MHTTCPDCGSDNPLTGGPNGKHTKEGDPYGPRTEGEGNGTTIVTIYIPRSKNSRDRFRARRALDATPCDDCGSEALVQHLHDDFKLEMAVRICKKGPYGPGTFAFCAEQLAVDGVVVTPDSLKFSDFIGLVIAAKDRILLAEHHRKLHSLAWQHRSQVKLAS